MSKPATSDQNIEDFRRSTSKAVNKSEVIFIQTSTFEMYKKLFEMFTLKR